ncbi:dihydroorotase [Rhodococcus sp. IEGM 1318]|uniref:dihydroorotase n=1 Tax=Rhodococcus sp. IEGM 1318 TaxID=3082226 RepID=UPI002953C287|nr:amidohydrolase family protein [Rhodococcus sp. IEGM 1318]MDV8009217.1 amidohydrolase family protein [Rhodococcus sp. IEGM 1318]
MRVDTIVANGRVVSPSGVVDAAIAIRDGRVVAIGDESVLPEATERIDAEGKYVLPGIVDPHVHLGGGRPLSEIFASETACAAVGGVTTVLQYRRSPSTFLETFPAEFELAQTRMLVDTQFHFIISTMEQVKEIPRYAKEFGVTSFKFYMGGYEPGNPIGLVSVNDAVLYAAMEHIRDLGPYGWCMVHCEDDSLVCHLTAQVKAEGGKDLAAYSESRPDFVEEQDLLRAIWLADLQGCPLYVPHTTVGMAVDAAAESRRKGRVVVLETCPHYLALTADNPRLSAEGSGVGKVAPALRNHEHQAELWRGLREGWISTIGSDHVPIAKSGKGFWEEAPGFAGLATMLPVVLTEGVLAGRISIEKVVETMAYNPARLFGLYPRKGTLQPGADADLVIVDMETEKVVGPDVTQSEYVSAFEGVPLRGWPTLTMRRGEVIYRDGKVLAEPGSGQVIVKPEPDLTKERNWHAA